MPGLVDVPTPADFCVPESHDDFAFVQRTCQRFGVETARYNTIGDGKPSVRSILVPFWRVTSIFVWLVPHFWSLERWEFKMGEAGYRTVSELTANKGKVDCLVVLGRGLTFPNHNVVVPLPRA